MRIRLVLLFIAIFYLLVGCTFYISQNFCRDWDKSIYYKFPASVSHVEEKISHGGRSCTFWLKFEISPGDLDDLVKTTFIELPLSATNLPKSMGGLEYLRKATGWNINIYSSFLAGEAFQHLDGMFIYVDTSNPQTYIVYIAIYQAWL